MTRRFLALLAFLLVTAAALTQVAGADNLSGAPAPTSPTMVAGDVVVQLRVGPGARESQGTTGTNPASRLDALRGRYNLGAMERVFLSAQARPPRQSLAKTPGADVAVPDLSRIYRVHLATDADMLDLLAELRRNPNVEWAEPNYLYHAGVWPPDAEAVRRVSSGVAREDTALPNDPFLSSSGSWGQPFPDLWGLFKIEAPTAWQVSQGEGVVVAVVDTGIDINHEDLAANVWHNPGEIPGNGIDDDGNGFVDDVNGWDFTHCAVDSGNGNCLKQKEPGPDVTDEFGHGTHVAGTIAAVGNNGIGVIGVAPRAHVMAVKALDGAGFGTTADLAAALVYAADNGAQVINASWGGPPTKTISTAVQYVIAKGVVLVTSAGNDATPIERGNSPADLPEVIAVGATTHADASAFFSNFGGPLGLVAPGGGDAEPASAASPFRSILSLLARDAALGQICQLECDTDNPDTCNIIPVCAVAPIVVGDSYLREAGTSMAAPHVSGVAALVRSRHPEFTRRQVDQVLFATADDLGPFGWDPTYGFGRVNAARAVAIDEVPVAEITVPGNEKVWDWQFPFTVQGNAFSPQTALRDWQLTLYEQDNGGATEISRGNTPIASGALGSIALSQVQRGKRYILELVVNDTLGNSATDTKSFLFSNPLFAVVPIPDPFAEGGGGTSLSGDGTRIALTRKHRGDSNDTIWLYDSLSRQLTSVDSGFGIGDGGVTADGERFFFSGFLPDGQPCGPAPSIPAAILYGIDAASYTCLGLQVFQLGPTDAHGTRMALTETSENSDGTSFVTEAFLYDVASRTVRQITQGLPGPFGDTIPEVQNLTMSLDGVRVAFDADVDLDPTASTGGIRQVFLYDDTGRTVRQLTGRADQPSDGACPSLSGDGKEIAYRSQNGIVLTDLTSRASKSIVDSSGGATCPLLSADGTQVAFTAAADLDPTVGNEDWSFEVFVADTESGAIHQVTDTHPLSLPACRNIPTPCYPGTAAIDAKADVFLVNDFGTEQAGLPLPLDPGLYRIVERQPGQPPVLTVPAVIAAPPSSTTHTILRATDPGNFPITFFVQTVPGPNHLRDVAQSILTDHGDGTADLAFAPELKDVGTYNLRVAAFDEIGEVAEQDIQLIVPSPSSSPSAAVPNTQTGTETPTPTSPTVFPSAVPSPHAPALATPALSEGDGCRIGRAQYHDSRFLLLATWVLVARRIRIRRRERHPR